MTKQKKMILIGAAAVGLLAIIVAIVALSCSAKKPSSPTQGPPSQEKPAVADTLAPKPAPTAYPLTGLPLGDEALAFNRPLSVKLENSPEARPQLGLSSADVVYETLTEGGITRFNCIFQSTIPAEVGPVRSGRNSDVTLVPQYDALFFMSGANDVVLGEIAAAGLADMSHTRASELYHRVDYRSMPHNLYLDLGRAWELAPQLGYPATVETPPSLEFGPSKTEGMPDAPNITIPFSDAYVAQWTYNTDEGLYYRAMDGPTMDADGDRQVSCTNVVVLWAEYLPVLDGSTQSIDMNQGGQASLFLEGKRIDGTWSSDGSTPPRFADQNGNVLKLAPGKTWFSILNIGAGITAG
ncbi:MAG: DUF3048 domain-containing protein [Coriobacteriales bacterium]|jgi:hypothetical protein|nr:DUF3048 domain-containing protein [Coriobacteriales bacterium]